jgi:hypothetical protein
VEEFSVDWGSDLPSDAPLALMVHVEGPATDTGDATTAREAIHEFFGSREAGSRRTVRRLFRRGRISLGIALAYLTASMAIGNGVAGSFNGSGLAQTVREGLLIGGWVAMWRPLEVFL